MTDQERVGLLLEGCALVACLRLAGERAAVDWTEVRVTEVGRLVGARLSLSQPAPLPQVSFCHLLHCLFGDRSGVESEPQPDLTIAGPGMARRSVRRLIELWRQRVQAVSVDRSLDEVFRAAPFLWRRRFSGARSSLACIVIDRGRASVAGPGPSRRRLLCGAPSFDQLVERLESDSCRAFWDGSSVVKRSSVGEERQFELREVERESRQAAAAALVSAVREARKALAHGDGDRAVEIACEELRRRRRGRKSHEALRLWIVLGQARELTSDLRGAERAFLHAFRLAERSRLDSLRWEVVMELAGVRLRQGPVAHAEAAFDFCCRRHERSKDWAVVLRCALRRAQGLLVGGRAAAAMEWCRVAVRRYGSVAQPREIYLLRLVSARTFAWMGDCEEARAVLDELPPGLDSFLDPEERPALYAQAGLVQRALGAAANTGGSACWRAILEDRAIAPDAWSWLADLTPFRRARAVFDIVLVASGRVPEPLLRIAAETLEQSGLVDQAARVAAQLWGPWVSLNRFLEAEEVDADSTQALFQGAGFGEVRLSVVSSTEERVLVDGRGGAEERRVPSRRGSLVLSASTIGPELCALQRVVADRLEPGPPAAAPVTGEIIGSSPELLNAVRRLDLLAPSGVPILLLGETGTGKELAARRAHALSPRARGPFVAHNAAGVSETLLLADLFGHVRGAFTGADRDRAGLFETAHGGTLLLDEIGDLPMPAQGALLRVLQEGEIRRVGESRVRRVDVRVIAATHRDLKRMTAEGVFREDL